MINWQYYPKSYEITGVLIDIIKVFQKNNKSIDSSNHTLSSNEVLSIIRNDLISLGFNVEGGRKVIDKIRVPVLFGRNGKPEKSFDADAHNDEQNIVLEVEAGRGYTNNQFLKDLFQACVMINIEFLVIAVRNIYRDKNKDFEMVAMFFDTLYASNRFVLPLKGILLIGY